MLHYIVTLGSFYTPDANFLRFELVKFSKRGCSKKVLSDFVARTSRQCTTSSSRLTSPSTRTSPSGRSLRRPSTTLKASPESVSSTRSRLLLKATFTTTTMTRKLQRMEDLFKSNYELKIMLARCITILLKIVAGNCISAQKENVSFSAEMHQ